MKAKSFQNPVLVTGGAGAIGSRLVSILVASGVRTIVVDNLSSGFVENLPKSELLTFVNADIDQPRILNEILSTSSERWAAVFHLAAFFANQNSVEHPERDLQVNGLGTLLICKKASELFKEGRLDHFVYASSSCVYGNFKGEATEEHPLHPDTPYACTKLLGEHYLDFFSRSVGMSATSLRLFNSYGPGERPGKYRNVIPNFIHKALKGEPLPITGTGNETRDFTYVDDVCDAMISASLLKTGEHRVFNLSSGRRMKIMDMARAVVAAAQSSSEIVCVPRRSWDFVLDRCGNSDRAYKAFGFRPTVDFETGLKNTVEWFRQNENFINLNVAS